MSELFEIGKQVLADQPFSYLLGAELTELASEKAEISLTTRDDLKQHQGFVHNGVVSYLADTTMSYAGGTVLGDSVTTEFKINFIRPSKAERLVAHATVVSSGAREAVCECKVFATGPKGRSLIATVQGTVSKLESGTPSESETYLGAS